MFVSNIDKYHLKINSNTLYSAFLISLSHTCFVYYFIDIHKFRYTINKMCIKILNIRLFVKKI